MYLRLCIMEKWLLLPKLTLIDTIDKILLRGCADYKSTRFTKMDCSHFRPSSNSSSRKWSSQDEIEHFSRQNHPQKHASQSRLILGEILILIIAGTARRTAQSFRTITPDAKQQCLSHCHFMRHNSVEFFQVRRRKPGFFVVVNDENSKVSGKDRRIDTKHTIEYWLVLILIIVSILLVSILILREKLMSTCK